MLKNKIFIISLFLSYYNASFAAMAPKTPIKTCDGLVFIETISHDDKIVALNLRNNQLETAPIQHVFSTNKTNAYQITVAGETICCTEDQFFYDPLCESWIPAKDISSNTHFLTRNLQVIPCLTNEKIELEEPTTFYEITLTKPHTLFISNAEILTHNFVPVIFGISFALGEGISLSGLGAGIGALGMGLWKKYGNTSELKFAQVERECGNTSAGGSPEDPDKKKHSKPIKVDNMEQFFETEFGTKIKDSVEKTNRQYQGQPIYRVREKIPEYGLKKGDQFYLDNLHRDHLEVFRKNDTFKTILNLDGTENIKKAVKVKGRNI